MTTPNHRDSNPPLPSEWQDDWPPSLPRPLPPPEPPAGEPADDVAQGTGYEDGDPPPTPTPMLTPAPPTPNGNADGESQTITEYEGEDEYRNTPDADAAAGDDVAQGIADVVQDIAYEQAGRPDAPRPDAAVTQTPPPATVILIMESGGNTEPSAGPFTPSGAAPESVPVFTPSVPATAQTPPQASISLLNLTPPAADVRDDGPPRATPRGYRPPPPAVKPRRQRHPFLHRGEARR